MLNNYYTINIWVDHLGFHLERPHCDCGYLIHILTIKGWEIITNYLLCIIKNLFFDLIEQENYLLVINSKGVIIDLDFFLILTFFKMLVSQVRCFMQHLFVSPHPPEEYLWQFYKWGTIFALQFTEKKKIRPLNVCPFTIHFHFYFSFLCFLTNMKNLNVFLPILEGNLLIFCSPLFSCLFSAFYYIKPSVYRIKACLPYSPF